MNHQLTPEQQRAAVRLDWLVEQTRAMHASPCVLLAIVTEGKQTGDPVVLAADPIGPREVAGLLRGLADRLEQQLQPPITTPSRN